MFNVITQVDKKGREPPVGELEWVEDQMDASDTCKHVQDIENDSRRSENMSDTVRIPKNNLKKSNLPPRSPKLRP